MRYSFLLLGLLQACVTSPMNPPTSGMDRIVRDLCDKNIVLLGEEGNHGNGQTIRYKAELIERLFDTCKFDSFMIEAGTYGFEDIKNQQRAGQKISEETMAAAVGLMWAVEEMKPLIASLTERVNAGQLQVSGIDDQIGRGSYAHTRMPAELLSYLNGTRQAECRSEIEHNKNPKFIEGCWKDIGLALVKPGVKVTELLKSHRHMISNLQRNIARQIAQASSPSIPVAVINDRETSMFQNFEWHRAQSSSRKTLLWMATIHGAKDLRNLNPPLEGRVPFGSYVHTKYSDQYFVLGFSALAGQNALGSTGKNFPIPPAPQDSLESKALASTKDDSRYLDHEQLRELGAIAAHPFNISSWRTGRWDQVLDGLVVLREEFPTHPIVKAPAP